MRFWDLNHIILTWLQQLDNSNDIAITDKSMQADHRILEQRSCDRGPCTGQRVVQLERPAQISCSIL